MEASGSIYNVDLKRKKEEKPERDKERNEDKLM